MKQTSFYLVIVLLTATILGHGQTKNENRMTSHPKELESLAHRADIEKPDTIDNLTHKVIGYPHIYSLPSPVTNALESDLARAEIAYRNGSGAGVTETQLVALMNSLAVKFKLPAYTRTTPAQVRGLRMRLVPSLPFFMGSGLVRREMAKGESIEESMSPLQAMHLLGVMIDQKIANPNYQDPLLDLDLREAEQRKQYMELAHAQGASGSHMLVSGSNPKRAEVLNAISVGAASMSLQDAYDMLNEILTTMRLK
jgi:hypothetical protein